jgi:hypothetical protein
MIVSWDDNSAIEHGFRIYTRKTTVGEAFALAKTVGPNIETATLTGLDYGTSYDIKVASYNVSGEHSQVGPVTRYTPPEFAPTSLTLTTANPTSVILSFTPPVAAPIRYQSYYRIDGGSTWIAGDTSASSPIAITGLTTSTAYEFMVRGYFTNPTIEGVAQPASYSPDSNVIDAATTNDPVLFNYRFTAGETHTGWSNSPSGGATVDYNDTTRSSLFGVSQTLGQRGGSASMHLTMEPPAHAPQDEMHYACGIVQDGSDNSYIFFVHNLIHVLTSSDGGVTLKTNGESVTIGSLPAGTIPRGSLRYVWLSVRRKIGAVDGYVTLVVSSSASKPTPSGSNSITGAFTNTDALTNIGIYKRENAEHYIRPWIASRDPIPTITI